MHSKRRRSKSGKHSDDQLDDGDVLDSDADDSIRHITDKDSIEYKILHTRHPFELCHFIESKHLTPSQRAISCCIQLNGGSATENQLLHFLQSNWNFIKKINTKLPNNMPDTRVMHINLVIKKKSIPLFIQNPNNPLVWSLNNSTKLDRQPERQKITRRSKSEVKNPTFEEDEVITMTTQANGRIGPPARLISSSIDRESFECIVLSAVKTLHKATIEEIAEHVKGSEGAKGLFPNLPFARRVRACLVSFRSTQRIYEKDGIWSDFPLEENLDDNRARLPDVLRNVRVNDFTIDQLWSVLKENHIYA